MQAQESRQSQALLLMDFSSFTDPQLVAIADAFDVASMETMVGEEGLIFWYAVLEEIARRDLTDATMRAEEADWIVGQLFPQAKPVLRPLYYPRSSESVKLLPGVSVVFTNPKP